MFTLMAESFESFAH